jgi:hypothetical protein
LTGIDRALSLAFRQFSFICDFISHSVIILTLSLFVNLVLWFYSSICSYINNLDRSKYPSLYQDFASLFALFVPLFRQIGVIPDDQANFQVIVKAANYILDPGMFA